MSDQEITLRETTDRLSEIFDELEESGGELTPEIEKDLERLTGDRKNKAQNIIQFSRRMKYMAEAIKGEAKRLNESAKKKLAASDRVERYLLAEMQNLGEKKMHTDLYTITRARIGRPRIELREGELIEGLPPNLIRVVPEKWEVDKDAVYKHYRDGDGIPKEVGQYELGPFDFEVRERISVS